MPAYWPDGMPIAETDLIVVVLNQDGSVKASAPFEYVSSTSDPSTPVRDRIGGDDRVILTWHREGSAAGYCKDGAVYWSGRVEITACEGVWQVEQRRLSEDTIDRLHAWTETYRSFEFEQRGAATEDGVRVRAALVGTGTRHVSEIEKLDIQELLMTLVLQ
jgi:hypothetical protein